MTVEPLTGYDKRAAYFRCMERLDELEGIPAEVAGELRRACYTVCFVAINSEPWPSFVVKKDYSVRRLCECVNAQWIWENGTQAMLTVPFDNPRAWRLHVLYPDDPETPEGMIPGWITPTFPFNETGA